MGLIPSNLAFSNPIFSNRIQNWLIIDWFFLYFFCGVKTGNWIYLVFSLSLSLSNHNVCAVCSIVSFARVLPLTTNIHASFALSRSFFLSLSHYQPLQDIISFNSLSCCFFVHTNNIYSRCHWPCYTKWINNYERTNEHFSAGINLHSLSQHIFRVCVVRLFFLLGEKQKKFFFSLLCPHALAHKLWWC